MSTVYDVSVMVAAELAQARLPIEEILDFTRGTVVEMGRQVVTSVTLTANGISIARGDIMVAGERLCVRITDMIDAAEASRKEAIRGGQQPIAMGDRSTLAVDQRGSGG
jgi:flagellar motor switch protein FliN/FliY